ncbi:hypothetical protein DL765_005618 [Monosporascus sp. GIB2]|nr:hypothetical protein DL765_005618 [Monosporascus sp. GIB2]
MQNCSDCYVKQAQIASRCSASALAADEEVMTLQHSASDENPQQGLIVQARDLTLLAPSPLTAGTPPGFSHRLVPSTEDATSCRYPERAEPAPITAAGLDARPTASLAADKANPEVAGEQMTISDKAQTARGRAALAYDWRRPSASVCATLSPQNSRSLDEEQAPLACQAVQPMVVSTTQTNSMLSLWSRGVSSLDGMPNELLTHILSFLDVSDLLATSRTNHHLRALSLLPILHARRLRQARLALPPLLMSPSRPTLPELVARRIVQTHTAQVSRRLARSLAAIRLARRLPQRPSAESLVQRGVLPPECCPSVNSLDGDHGGGGGGGGGVCYGYGGPVSPALVARRRAVERERLKDGLRRWVGAVWKGEVRVRGEGVRRYEESAGVGRVWRLRKFWETVGREA